MSSPREFNNKIRKNSLDDLEIEKIRKETAGSIGKSTGSQDDFSVKSPKLGEEEFLAKFTNNKEVAKPKSAIRRFFSSIGNSAIVNKVKSGVNWLLNTKIGKILTGTAFGRATTIIFATVTLATVFPIASPVVFAMAGVSLAAVAIGAAFDTYKTRNLRKLATENNLLVKNHGYLKKQEQLFKIDPSLKKVIDEYETDKEKTRNKQIASKKNIADKYEINYALEAVDGIKKALVDNIPSIASTVASASTVATGNVLGILKTIKDGAVMVGGLSYAGYSTKQGIDLVTALKININNELKDQNISISDYKNLQELGKIVKDQEIHTMVMTELMRDKDYFKLTEKQKVEKFKQYKASIAKLKEKEMVKKVGYLGDLVKAHNPFYEQPNKVPEHTELTKAMKKDIEKSTIIDSPLQRPVSFTNIPKYDAKRNFQSKKGKKRDSTVSL